MRLLPKSEVDKAKATERKREVEEGLKLAKRVDSLREIAVAEEASLEKFRRETVKAIHEEITAKAEERDSLQREIRSLKVEREELKKPLNAEWKEIHEARIFLDGREEGQNLRENGLNWRENTLKDREHDAERIFNEATLKSAFADTRLHAATKAEDATQSTLARARKTEEDALALKKGVDESLLHREKLVGEREKDATLREKDLSAREKELADQWILLKDREDTLARNYQRLHKKHV